MFSSAKSILDLVGAPTMSLPPSHAGCSVASLRRFIH